MILIQHYGTTHKYPCSTARSQRNEIKENMIYKKGQMWDDTRMNGLVCER